MRKLNIFTCIQVALHDHIDPWQANHYEIQSENRKWIIQHNLSFSLKSDTNFCCITQRTLLGGQRLWSGFLVFFFLFIFGLWFVAIFYSAVKAITQTIKPFEHFYFSLSIVCKIEWNPINPHWGNLIFDCPMLKYFVSF